MHYVLCCMQDSLSEEWGWKCKTLIGLFSYASALCAYANPCAFRLIFKRFFAMNPLSTFDLLHNRLMEKMCLKTTRLVQTLSSAMILALFMEHCWTNVSHSSQIYFMRIRTWFLAKQNALMPIFQLWRAIVLRHWSPNHQILEAALRSAWRLV